MTVDEALKKYIKMMEEYEPKNFEQEAIKLYMELESATKVAVELNKKDYKVGNRKIISKDVTDLIRAKAQDEVHELAQKMLKKNMRRAQGRGWL